MDKYSLIGVDGNAYFIMGYVSKALKREGLSDLVDKYIKEATSSDYHHLVFVSCEYIDMANRKANKIDGDDNEGESEEKK